MKLTKSMLKKIIAEEVKKMSEGLDPPMTENIPSLGDFESEVTEMWLSEYDESDPVMGEFGEDAWVAQCNSAVEELIERIETSVVQIHNKLHAGDYGLGF